MRKTDRKLFPSRACICATLCFEHQRQGRVVNENEQIDAAPLLDAAVLGKVASDTSWDFVAMTVNQFFDETHERIPRMLENARSGDWSGLAGEAHALKGSSAWFGSMRLNALAKRIEMAAKAADEGAVSEAVAGLEAVAENSIMAIKDHLQSR